MRNSACLLALVFATTASADLVYFLVGERFPINHRDSYVLPLSDPDDIQHARDLATFDPSVGQRIVLARIAKGSDGINRNYLAPGQPLWNWHVDEFLGFADITAEIYDGWPTFVEEDLDGWFDNTGGFIGFWGYTVIAELTAVPERSSLAMIFSATLLGVGVGFRKHLFRGRRSRCQAIGAIDSVQL